jgi:hypothetical protein
VVRWWWSAKLAAACSSRSRLLGGQGDEDDRTYSSGSPTPVRSHRNRRGQTEGARALARSVASGMDHLIRGSGVSDAISRRSRADISLLNWALFSFKIQILKSVTVKLAAHA